MKSVLESRQVEIKTKQQQIGQGQERIQRLELQLKEQKVYIHFINNINIKKKFFFVSH